MTERTVACEQAFRWTCPDCGRENFDRAQLARFDNQEEEREVREALGVEPWEEGGVVTIPDTVTCLGCLAMFATVDERAEDEE